MNPRRISVVLVPLIAAILLLAASGCGDNKSTNPPPGGNPTSGPPISDGTWEIRYAITVASGGPECAAVADTSVDTTQVIGGNSDFFGTNCSYTRTGSNFTQTCRDTIAFTDSCHVLFTVSGSGQTTGSTFTATYTVTITSVGSCSGFGLPSCTFNMSVVGRKLSAAPLATTHRGGTLPEVLSGISRTRLLERILPRPR